MGSNKRKDYIRRSLRVVPKEILRRFIEIFLTSIVLSIILKIIDISGLINSSKGFVIEQLIFLIIFQILNIWGCFRSCKRIHNYFSRFFYHITFLPRGQLQFSLSTQEIKFVLIGRQKRRAAQMPHKGRLRYIPHLPDDPKSDSLHNKRPLSEDKGLLYVWNRLLTLQQRQRPWPVQQWQRSSLRSSRSAGRCSRSSSGCPESGGRHPE